MQLLKVHMSDATVFQSSELVLSRLWQQITPTVHTHALAH